MHKSMRSIAAIGAAAILAITAAGCGGTEKPAAGAQSPKTGQEQTTVKVEVIERSQAPQELQDWASAIGMPSKPNYKVITVDGSLYMAIAAGQQTSGGYKVEVTEVHKTGKALLVAATLTAPPPGSIVTMQLMTPVGYFKLPNASGEVQVTFDGAAVTAAEPTGNGGSVGGLPVPGNLGGMTVEWTQGNMLKVTGTAKVADVHFTVKKGDQVIAQADAQVKGGEYIANLIVEGGFVEGLTLEVSNPATGEVLSSTAVAR